MSAYKRFLCYTVTLIYVSYVYHVTVIKGSINHEYLVQLEQDNSFMSINTKPKPTVKEISWPNPVIVIGMPKAGTNSIHSYFKCGNVTNMSHYMCSKQGACGILIRRNVEQGKPPLTDTGKRNVYTQLDYVGKKRSYFPQIEIFDSIYKHHPNSTFILNGRNVTDWIKSLKKHHGMAHRILKDNNVTGLPKMTGEPPKNITIWGEKGWRLKKMYETHYDRVREFARNNPSFQLVDLAIDSPDAGQIMEEAFGIDKDCWGQKNLGHWRKNTDQKHQVRRP